jgi:signal transduction histidine kinase
MKNFWLKISDIGISEELDVGERRSIEFLNRICAIFFVLSFLSLVINLVLQTWGFVPALVIVLFLLSGNFVLNHFKFFMLSKMIALFAITGLVFYMCFNGGYGSGLEFYFLSMITLPVFLFKEKKIIYFFQSISIACLIYQKFYAPVLDGAGAAAVVKIFYVFNSAGSSLLIILAIIFYKNITLKNENELHKKSKIIEDKNRLLEDVNLQLETFSYSVSHDLKAPLRAIDGYSWILESEHSNNMTDEQKELLANIRTGAAKMKEMIDNLLLLARSSKKQVMYKKIDMNELTKSVLKSFEKEITKYKTKIILKDMPAAFADEDLISHVLENLISNAIKYSRNKEQPEVEIGGSKSDNGVTYYVRDNGAGFNMKYANKLFIPFQRLHTETEFEGTGVGLSIVKNIVKRHNGNVWVEAKENEGAVFYFSLPGSIPAVSDSYSNN